MPSTSGRVVGGSD